MDSRNQTLELLIFITLVVCTSAVVLAMIHFDIIHLRPPDSSDQPILNAEFIPFERDGNLLVEKFEFCRLVTPSYQCLDPQNVFQRGSPTHFRLLMNSDVTAGFIKLEENYRIKGPTGQIYLEVGDREAFHYQKTSRKSSETVALADSFTVSADLPAGQYILEVFVFNPQINKKITLTRTFEMR